MELINQIQGRLEGWIKSFDKKNLKDKTETVFIDIVAKKNKTTVVGVAVGEINSKKPYPVYTTYDDGMILDKETTRHIVKISNPDHMSPDEEIFFVTVTAESMYDSDMVANHITHCLIEFLEEKNLLKFAA